MPTGKLSTILFYQCRYHCYSSLCEEQIYTSTDISHIIEEISRAQEVLKKIQDMRKGMLDSTLVSIMNEISAEIDKLPQSRFLPRPPGHDLPLQLDNPKFQPSSSVDWLRENGLKFRKLDLYQVLAPNAYSYREEFIPAIRKTVQSQVHERAMTQFSWHDGSIKNVHVDMAQLFEYQKQLGLLVKVFEQRINWLASASRKLFGRSRIVHVIASVSWVVYNKCNIFRNTHWTSRRAPNRHLSVQRELSYSYPAFNAFVTWTTNE